MAQGPDGNGAGASEGKEDSYPAAARTSEDGSYEAQMENRSRNILKSVDGVGKVDVMVVLKSSSEKVLRVDRSTNTSTCLLYTSILSLAIRGSACFIIPHTSEGLIPGTLIYSRY